jgi:hypothetical protein
MLKIKVTEKSGASIEYLSEQMLDLSKFGHGRPERWQKEYREFDLAPGVEPYDRADVIAEEDRPSPVDPETLEHWVKLKADYSVEVEDVTYAHELAQCIANRKAEYPTPEQFLNAFFDGGQSELDALHAQRLEIKAKHPKPQAE